MTSIGGFQEIEKLMVSTASCQRALVASWIMGQPVNTNKTEV